MAVAAATIEYSKAQVVHWLDSSFFLKTVLTTFFSDYNKCKASFLVLHCTWYIQHCVILTGSNIDSPLYFENYFCARWIMLSVRINAIGHSHHLILSTICWMRWSVWVSSSACTDMWSSVRNQIEKKKALRLQLKSENSKNITLMGEPLHCLFY